MISLSDIWPFTCTNLLTFRFRNPFRPRAQRPLFSESIRNHHLPWSQRPAEKECAFPATRGTIQNRLVSCERRTKGENRKHVCGQWLWFLLLFPFSSSLLFLLLSFSPSYQSKKFRTFLSWLKNTITLWSKIFIETDLLTNHLAWILNSFLCVGKNKNVYAVILADLKLEGSLPLWFTL